MSAEDRDQLGDQYGDQGELPEWSDPIAGRRSGQAFSAHRGRWDGTWWRCPARLPDSTRCRYWERGLREGSYGDGYCPDHDRELEPSPDGPDREASG
jgi:hypothetical protein